MSQSTSFFNAFCNGSGGRLALGSSVLVYLIAYNETSAPGVFFATLLATVYGCIAAQCKTSIRSIQIPYIRASNKFDFGCLFLASWLDILALMCACSTLARTLSTCLDAMTGGLSRILILGRDSTSNEVWPDLLGVAVVFIITGMFMLGLEAFSFIMTLGMFGLNAILSSVGWWNGDTKAWSYEYFQPNGVKSFITAASLLTFTFPADFPIQCTTGAQQFRNLIMITLVSISLLLSSGCLSTVIHFKIINEYIAVPFIKILEENNFQKLVSAGACLLLLTCSGAYLELFPEFYGLITKFASSEWKLLSRQIAYESSDSGNPVLAVFISGSLCAMLSFACPMRNLLYTLAASHLWAGVFRTFYLLYSPYRPKHIQYSSENASSYSRLAVSNSSSNLQNNKRLKGFLSNIGLSKQKPPVKKPHIKPKNAKPKVEKEWLLLVEPGSPSPQREQRDVEMRILSDGEPSTSDIEFQSRMDNSDSDSSTDIDAIVDEYRDQLKVTTAGTMEDNDQIPTLYSWRVMIFAITVVGGGIALTIAGIISQWVPAALTGSIGVFIISIMMNLIPKYPNTVGKGNPILCCLSILLGMVFFAHCAEYSWLGIITWLLAGVMLLLRCDNWCCNCLDPEPSLSEELIPSVSGKTLATRSIIRLPKASKSLIAKGMTNVSRDHNGSGR